jgi:hypothetical protein
MKKTSVYMPTEEAEGLRRLAIRERRSQAELIREGIRYVIGAGQSRPRPFHSLGRRRGAGRPYEKWDADDLYRKAMGGR